MKIGILTIPFNNNYGGFLQAFALKKVLTDMGHETLFINRRRNKSKGLKGYLKRFLISCNLKKDKYAEKVEEISLYTNRFKQKYLEPITEEYYTTKELKRCLQYNLNCFVVGSDQVWRYKYAKESIDDFFFSFLKGTGIPRFSYAASMGTDEMEYPDSKLEICKKLLKEFNAVSVREKSTLQLLSENFECKNANLVLDPTILLPPEEYTLLFKEFKPKFKTPYAFTYILDETEEKEAIINYVLKIKELVNIKIKAQTGDLFSIKIIEPVEQWLLSIYYSNYVITDSFHGMVFAIIFNKPFIVIANPQRGMTRVMDLLSRFNLEDRLVVNVEDVKKIYNRDINWDLVQQAINKERINSIAFINKVLNSI